MPQTAPPSQPSTSPELKFATSLPAAILLSLAGGCIEAFVYLNHGHVFACVIAAYPPLFWLLARCVWIGWTDRSPRGAAVWPVWLLAGAAVFIGGFPIGLHVR